MYAVVKISGKQWKVETQNRIFVDKLPFKKDEIVPLDQVLLIRQENKITIGTPFVDKAIVQAKVLEQTRDKKIVVFKKKRRKGYKKKQGHRQYKTTLLIEKILVDGKALVEDTKNRKWQFLVFLPTHCLFSCQNSEFRSQLFGRGFAFC